MLCKNTPPPASPIGSEISVGSPSPPPPLINLSKTLTHSICAPQPLSHRQIYEDPYETAKGLKPDTFSEPESAKQASYSRSRSPSPLHIVPPALPATSQAAGNRLNPEKVKSFSIADILGNREANHLRKEVAVHQLQQQLQLNNSINNHNLNHLNMVASKIVRPWDHLRGPIPVRPFLPSALFHYEQRLALDYQRQLQEHLHAQAELLRQRMSIDVIHSETGSERSSSVASDCCSPSDLANRLSADSVSNHHHSSKYSPRTRSNPNGISSTTIGQANSSNSASKNKPNDTPLDALFQLTNKNFDETDDQAHIDLFANKQNPKKKRKSRTAFTNHQIFELEKRFLYQKYLSPADRDEIAAGLGLSNAQVITWFQNRRAKLKRDMEELKKDVESVKALSAQKSFLENVNDLSILKKKPQHDRQPADDDHHHHHHNLHHIHQGHHHHMTIAHHHHPPATES